MPTYTKVCDICGVEFTTTKRNQKRHPECRKEAANRAVKRHYRKHRQDMGYE